MSLTVFADEARRIVMQQREPPRSFAISILWHLIRDRESILISLFGLIGILFGGYIISRFPGDWAGLLFGGIGCVAGIFVCFVLVVHAFHWHRSLRYGRLLRALVIEVSRKNSRDTSFRAEQYGSVQGVWEVQIDGQYLRESFSLNQPWSNSVSVGSQVLVLAHPHKPKLWVPVGM
jgi:hypothetical protein